LTQTGGDARLYPQFPLLAVSIALFRNGELLLIKRAKPPLEGLFSLPGGLVERGELLEEAARRELWEEVEMKAGPLIFNQHAEIIERDLDGGVKRHFVIASFTGLWISGTGRMSNEVSEIFWTAVEQACDLPLTPNLAEVMAKAKALLLD
jgi:ADP-ribose pyrophosphatase YjhB (NUDIX family)